MAERLDEYGSLLAKACAAPFDAEELARGLVNARSSLPGSHASVRTTRRGTVYGARTEPLTALFVVDPTLKVAVEGAASPEDKLRVLRQYSVWIQYGAAIGAPRPWLEACRHVDDDDCTVLRNPKSDKRVAKEFVDLDLWDSSSCRPKRPCHTKKEDVPFDELTSFPTQTTELGLDVEMAGAPETPPQSTRSLEEDVQTGATPTDSGRGLIGCRLTKWFQGRLNEGEVWGYDPKCQQYRVAYENGERAVLKWDELRPLLLSQCEERIQRTEMEDRRREQLQYENELGERVEDVRVQLAVVMPETQQSNTSVFLQMLEQELAQERARISELEACVESLQEGKRQHLAELETLCQSLQIALAARERAESNCREERKREIEALKLEHLAEVEGLKQQQLERERAVKAEVDDLKLRHVREIKDVRLEHAAEVKSLTLQHAAAMKQLKQKRATETADLKREHAKEIEVLRLEQQKQAMDIEGLKLEHSREVEALKLERVAEMRGLRQQHVVVTEELEQKRNAEVEIEGLKLRHAREIACLEREWAGEIEGLKREHAAAMRRQDLVVKGCRGGTGGERGVMKGHLGWMERERGGRNRGAISRDAAKGKWEVCTRRKSGVEQRT